MWVQLLKFVHVLYCNRSTGTMVVLLLIEMFIIYRYNSLYQYVPNVEALFTACHML